MNKLTIISSNHESGKIDLAAGLVEGKNSFWTTPDNLLSDLKSITDKTEIIVIQDVEFPKNLKHLMTYVFTDTITFRRPYARETVTMKTPEIIICTESEIPELPTIPNFEIITYQSFLNK